MILILGSGRSGTTWLAKLFDSHPDVLYRHEPDAVRFSTDLPFLPDRRDIEPYLPSAARYLLELQQDRSARSLGTRPFFGKSYRRSFRNAAFISGVTILKMLEGLGVSFSMQLPQRFERCATAEVVIVVKSVNSLCRAFLFRQAMPHIKIIHIVRHPCGVIASRLRGISRGVMPSEVYLESLCKMEEAKKYPFNLDCLYRSSLAKQMAYSWMIMNDKVIEEMQGDNHYYLIRYEDLCQDTFISSRKMFKFAGLSWSDQTEEFIHCTHEKRSAGYFSVMRAPGSTMHRWRCELSGEHINEISSVISCSRIYNMFEW